MQNALQRYVFYPNYTSKARINLYICGMKYDMGLIYAILNGKISEAINKRFLRNFSLYDVDLTPDQWTILNCLWKRNGMMQMELCKSTLMDKPAMTRIIDRMSANGLVERRCSHDDRRIRYIFLTNKAYELQEKARFVANKTMKEVLRGLSEDELSASQDVLRMVFSNTKEPKKPGKRKSDKSKEA